MTTDDAWIVETLEQYEPAALHTQLPVVWDQASGGRVTDSQGRSWLDWTSGILTANAGHAPPQVAEAIRAMADRPLLHAYSFPTRVRALLVRALAELSGFAQVILVTTGSEAAETCLKLARSYAVRRGRHRAVVMSFDGGFHGRTLGAQLAGGTAARPPWAIEAPGVFVRVPFPARGRPWNASVMEAALADVGAGPADVACVIGEVYQGKTMEIMDEHSAAILRDWCTRHGVLLVLDEIQSGFGRTGALFGHQLLGIRPDIMLCGKGLSGSLPVSAVLLADARYAEELPPGELNTTHGANPVALAAAEANVRLFQDGTLVKRARALGELFTGQVTDWAAGQPGRYQMAGAIGMVAGFYALGPGGSPDARQGRRLVEACAERGLLLCVPAGRHGALIKAMPPLTVSEQELREGLACLAAARDALEEGRNHT